MQRTDSFHIYDRRVDYSVTNIRDILFDIDKTKDTTEDKESGKLRSSRSQLTQLNLIGKGRWV